MNSDLNNKVLNFNKKLSFEEFKILVDKYSNISKYPDIGN
jgi:hypothetical protein